MTTIAQFEIGEAVMLGTQKAIVYGVLEHAYRPDRYELLIVDDAGVPFEALFEGYLISKLTTH